MISGAAPGRGGAGIPTTRRRAAAARSRRRPRRGHRLPLCALRPAVFGLAAQALDRGTAEEIVQDVFVAVWRGAASFDPDKGPVRPWLLQIAHYRIANELRRRSRRPRTEGIPMRTRPREPSRSRARTRRRDLAVAPPRDPQARPRGVAAAAAAGPRPRLLRGPVPRRDRVRARPSARHREVPRPRRAWPGCA